MREFSSESTILLVLFIASLLTLLHSFLLFHVVAELFAIVVAFSIFSFGWNSRHYAKDGGLVVIASGFLMIGVVDLLHTISYKGMGIFDDGVNLATELWIVGRYLLVATFLIATFYVGKQINAYKTVALYFVAAFLLVLTVFGGIFPVCFVDGEGLTPFKIVSEYIVMALFVVAIVRIKKLPIPSKNNIIYAIIFAIISEMFFTLYTDPYGISNILGHIFKVISYYILFRTIVRSGLINPMETLSTTLKHSEDQNRRTATILAKQARFSGAAEAISNIAHHWRQPLSVVSISLEDIKDLFLNDKLTKEDLVDSVDRSLTAINKISHQIEAVRAQYRSQQSIKTEDLALTIDTALELLRNELELIGVVIERKYEMVLVRTYHNELVQAVVNVLKNSIDVLKERHIENPTIVITISKTALGAVIVVADNGGGFDHKILKRAFEPYATTKHQSFGVGLGLYMGKLIIEEHLKGKIDVSNVNSSAVVTIEIGSIKG